MRAAPIGHSLRARRVTIRALVALVAMLAAGATPAHAVTADADTSLRVPGTTLRFGLAEGALADRGFRRTARHAWQGECRFFGLPAQVTVSTHEGRLISARFAVAEVSPAAMRFVEDDLRRQGYRRHCEGDAPEDPCEWTGRSKLRVSLAGQALDARAERLVAASPEVAEATTPPASADSSVTATIATSGHPDAARAGAAAHATESIAPAAGAVAAKPLGAAATSGPSATPTVPITSRADSLASAPAPSAVPVAVDSCVPALPAAARRAGVQGRVVVHSLVDTDGAVIDARVLRGPPLLHEAAIACARRWRFRPATVGGRAVREWVDLSLLFLAPGR